MFKDEIIWIKINSISYYNVLIKLNDIGITVFDNKKYKDYILIKTTKKDYKKIKKYLVSYKTSIYSNSGFGKLKEILNKYVVFTISIILSIILLSLVNNIIFKVEVKSSNKNTKELLINELKKYNLGVMKLKKNHKDIEIIVKNILDNNKDTLEWLEIKYDGLIMIVNVTEKSKNNINNNHKYCDIVASTDAKIISMNLYRGIPLKEINDYVLKGDTLISGSITHNEEVKNIVCAEAEIYGEVWYKVHVEVPLEEERIEYTGKNRYNVSVKVNGNDYDVFKSRIEGHKEKEKTNLYTLNNFEINLVKEKEYKINSYKLSNDEAYNKGIKEALEKIKLTLDENEEILLQKVLKKNVFNSTIVLDIFVVTKENIATVKELEEVHLNGGESSP